MKFVLRSTDMPKGYKIVPSTKLLMINFSLTSERTKNIVSGFDYPHISCYCSYLATADKAYGLEITAIFDAFHISFSDSAKVWKLVTPGSPPGAKVLITDDNSKTSATLGVSATVSGATWTAADVCTNFFLPILNNRAATA